MIAKVTLEHVTVRMTKKEFETMRHMIDSAADSAQQSGSKFAKEFDRFETTLIETVENAKAHPQGSIRMISKNERL